VLDGLRVLDLAHERGLLCGQILADLGADVILVEPPEGARARRLGPFYKDEPHRERSLHFAAWARGKRSLALDLDTDEGRARLRELARGADFLIESDTPGEMAARGLDFASLERVNPALVYVSLTPFGQDGPKARYATTDLVVLASGGAHYLTGDPDRAPLRLSVPQAFLHAAADGALGALIAHFERERSGRGQHVDVSAQQSLTLATLYRSLDVPWGQLPAMRVADGLQLGKVFVRTRYRTKDGLAVLGPGFLPSTGPFLTRLMRWAHEEGLCDERFVAEEWSSFGLRALLGQVEASFYAPVDQALARLFATRDNAEILREAVARKLLVAPALALDAIDRLDHFRERGFWRELEQPELGGRVRFPGPFARFGDGAIEYRRGAPRLGEHGAEVLGEVRPPRERARAATAPGALALEGVKILDLFWVLAGPAATRALADFGATVVHVESTKRLDTIRTVPPYKDGVPLPENSGPVQGANAGKLGITLDLAHPEAREVIEALVRWADVVTESFAPGVMKRLRLDYDSLRAIRPDVILISSCLMGQSGTLRDFAGFGNLAASVTGFQHLAGWPDRDPPGPAGAYTDYIAARYNAIAILAALERRRRTGRGQYVDQSQAEAALHFLTPALLDCTRNGRNAARIGNDDAELYPHGVFAAAGVDRWLALAVRDARDWSALAGLLGRADWRGDAALASAQGRRERRAEIDAALAAWVGAREAAAAERELQARGVPAHEVLDMAGLWNDAQLRHRQHWAEIRHPTHGSVTTESARFRLSRTPAQPPVRALTFGCDNRRVLGEMLGFPAERIAELEAKGVLS
jgi:crotonobetainyl-CoA:carnitine CoA-transferase CaiB-like acyl-CoA transferase